MSAGHNLNGSQFGHDPTMGGTDRPPANMSTDDFPPLSDDELDEIEKRWQANEHPPSRDQLKARNKARQKVGVDTEPLPPKPRPPRQPKPVPPEVQRARQVRGAMKSASQLGKLARLAGGGKRRW